MSVPYSPLPGLPTTAYDMSKAGKAADEEHSPALRCLNKMRDEVFAEKDKSGACTLSYWRFSNPDFYRALEDFAKAPDWSYDDANEEECIQEVQKLFTRMNEAMIDQERNDFWPQAKVPVPSAPQWSVVFAGKWTSTACSIAEQLVHILCTTGNEDSRVYTISRSDLSKDPADGPLAPSSVVHFRMLNLEVKGAHREFLKVMHQVIDDWEKEHANGELVRKGKTPIIFYFTLAKHKGSNLPFQRNIQAANSFVEALESVAPSRLVAKGIPFKVVITGTDATNPSTQEDPTLTVKGIPTSTPKYKIVSYNTVYAASKLCQFYSIAASMAKMNGCTVTPPLESSREGNDGSLSAIAKQLQDFVFTMGDNGTYRENEVMTDKELDAISVYWNEVAEVSLSDYVQTAKDISVCYTPLHRDPWTQVCLKDKSKESPKTFMIQNIIWRLKNAISIDRAARAHL